ncbi:cold shock domain-containing protein [Endozoicomonas ascidiicola]|uniref:cold shock domain-containing protein n=1 Tax=Endozoicomonas ascidiicola TaxID=1698521 RepID=UPI000A511BF1|nr:cold shock domain-containing protein [Endozoicomonas ascidiicola]
MISTGRIKTWNEDRGFGFIQSDELPKDIFVHISALKGLARKPRVGDIIHFQVENQPNGKLRAVNCSIEGVAKVAPSPRKSRPYRHRKKPGFIRKLLPAAVIMAVIFGYQKLANSNVAVPEPQSVMSLFESKSSNSAAKFSCNGKIHCSQMTSCEEATFYQNNCPGTNMDGDRDGVPCERQLCNSW